MNNSHTFSPQIKVWILVPSVISTDSNIDYYYDFSQSIAEYTKVFTELNIEWKWQPVSVSDYTRIIDSIALEQKTSSKKQIVFNLCDGDEINGTPGISVIQYLESKQLLYTGAEAYFYAITTSKIEMKQAFDKYKVSTPLWKAISNKDKIPENILETLGSPVIVKPAVSGGSMGIGIKNVVHNFTELREQVNKMFEGYRGWNLANGGIVAEQFINGPEFTVFIVGDYTHPEDAIIYPPVERVFHSSLTAHEKFLSFDRLWEIYEDETPMPQQENFYTYDIPLPSLHESIKQISWDAFVACKGTGYTRADIRMDILTGKLYVLEVNAQCGLSEDEDYTSIGAILKFAGVSFTELIEKILSNTLKKCSN